MNKSVSISMAALVLFASLPVCARPGPGPGPRPGGPRSYAPPPRHYAPPPPRHHHHGGTAFGIGAGILGGAILARTVYDATHPEPVIVTPAPVVVTPAPVIVTPAPVVTAGHYETRLQNVWVEGRYIDQTTPQGTIVRTWQPGHYEQQSVQVWVQ